MELPLVTNYEELTLAYKKRIPYFAVKGDLVEAMKEVSRGQISNLARIGTELGSRGSSLVLESLHLMVHRVRHGKNTKEEKLKDNIGMVYQITIEGEDTLYLRLKSLDY